MKPLVDSERPHGELKAGALLSYVVIALEFLAVLLYTPVMLRLLGQAEFGLYSVVASVVSYLGLLSFGFAGAYMRFYARYRVVEDQEAIRRLNGVFLVVFCAISATAAMSGTVLALNAGLVLGDKFSADEQETARTLIVILTVNLAMTFPTSIFNSFIAAHERFIFQKSLLAFKAVASPLVILPILLLGYGSIGMAFGSTFVNVLLTVWTVRFARGRLRMQFTFRGLEFSLLREVSVFSSFLFINMVVDQVNWNVDKFIIGRFHGAVPVAIYGVAGLLNTSYMLFSTAISGMFIPRVNRMVASARSDREISDLFIRVGRMQFLVLGLVVTGFVFFGRFFVEIWAGSSYSDVYVIALLLLIPVTIPLIQNLGIEIQKAKNLHQFRSWVYLGVAVGNILMSIPLTERFGGIGAAAATAVALVIGNGILINWHYSARVGLDIRSFWLQIIRVAAGMLPALGGGTIIALTVDLSAFPMLILFGSIYVLVYVAGVWWLGMNDYERSVFGSLVRRLLRKRNHA